MNVLFLSSIISSINLIQKMAISQLIQVNESWNISQELKYGGIQMKLQGSISQRNLSLATYHFVLDLSPKTDLSLFVKSAPGGNQLKLQVIVQK